jgi:hypothetical protein
MCRLGRHEIVAINRRNQKSDAQRKQGAKPRPRRIHVFGTLLAAATAAAALFSGLSGDPLCGEIALELAY